MRFTMTFLAFAAMSFAAQPTEDEIKKELKLFQGKWSAVFVQDIDGKPFSEEKLKGTTMTIDGDKFKMTTPDSELEGTFKIDPTKKIKTIDIHVGDEKAVALGIYEIQGDIRRSCFATPDKGRPDGIRKEEGYVVLEWKRAK